MTLTKHGHHIPGTKDDDEDPNAKRARCGGCQICQDCYWEWRSFKKHKSEVKEDIVSGMKMGANSSGSGRLTVGALKSLLDDLPDEAELRISATEDQRDGWFWSVSAEWGEDRFKTERGTRVRNISAPPRIGDSVRDQADLHYGAYGVGAAFPGDH